MPPEDARLTRIEDKVDKLGEALVMMARIEERQLGMLQRIESYQSRLKDAEGRIDELEQINDNRSPVFKWVDRLAVATLGAAIAYVASKLNFGEIP